MLWYPGEVRTPLSQGLHRLIDELLAEVDLCKIGAAGGESLGRGGKGHQSPSLG